MIQANQDIRKAAREAGVWLWQVAEALGLYESHLSRKLRHELPQAEKDHIFEVIRRLEQRQETVS